MASYNFTQTYGELQDIVDRGDTYFPVTASTTYAEISAAVTANQKPIFTNSGVVYLYGKTASSTHYFYAVVDDTLHVATITSAGVWAYSTTQMATAASVTSAVAAEATARDSAIATATDGMVYQDSSGYLYVND